MELVLEPRGALFFKPPKFVQRCSFSAVPLWPVRLHSDAGGTVGQRRLGVAIAQVRGGPVAVVNVVRRVCSDGLRVEGYGLWEVAGLQSGISLRLQFVRRSGMRHWWRQAHSVTVCEEPLAGVAVVGPPCELLGTCREGTIKCSDRIHVFGLPAEPCPQFREERALLRQLLGRDLLLLLLHKSKTCPSH